MKKTHIIILLALFLLNRAFTTLTFEDKLSEAALLLTHQQVSYDPTYFNIAYPNGDVPADKGIIRAI